MGECENIKKLNELIEGKKVVSINFKFDGNYVKECWFTYESLINPGKIVEGKSYSCFRAAVRAEYGTFKREEERNVPKGKLSLSKEEFLEAVSKISISKGAPLDEMASKVFTELTEREAKREAIIA